MAYLRAAAVLTAFSCICIVAYGASSAAANPYTPLWLYNGSWRVTRGNLPAGSKPDDLHNDCALVGKYFACQQTINGETGALLIFVPANEPGHYYTQNIRLDGIASGRGNLLIEGNRWTYTSSWNQGGGTSTYYKTVNIFTGKDRIHFEQYESKNNRDWKMTNSGDEVRIASDKRK